MKIVILGGSPHRGGTSALLIDQFIRGARTKGHYITRFDLAFENMHPCRACNCCVRGDGTCVYRDAMDMIRPKLLDADLVVLASPMYYFGFSSQLKMAIDRFYAFNGELLEKPKKCALLMTCGDNDDWIDEAVRSHYNTLCKYLHWESVGEVVARGVYEREDIEKTNYSELAFSLGASI